MHDLCLLDTYSSCSCVGVRTVATWQSLVYKIAPEIKNSSTLVDSFNKNNISVSLLISVQYVLITYGENATTLIEVMSQVD